MANASILAAFERMWHHVVVALNNIGWANIANKPFGDEKTTTKQIADNVTVNFTAEHMSSYAVFPVQFSIESDTQYDVTINGTVYHCNSITLDTIYIGNTLQVGGPDTGEPFLFTDLEAYGRPKGTIAVIFNDVGTYTISISSTRTEIEKLDSKYISTHGEEACNVEICDDTFPFEYSGVDGGYYIMPIANTMLGIGSVYDVVWDGTEYKGLVCMDDGGYPTIGSTYNEMISGESDIPFILFSDPVLVAITKESGESHTIKITKTFNVRQLDDKFIPSNIARIDDLENVGGAVASVNGKTGEVTLTASDVGAVPTSRTVNGKALSSNITLSASDVGARASTWMPSASDVGARSSTWMPSASDVGAVPTSRTVNGKALSSNITLSASDVGARASTWMPSASDVGAVPTSRTVNGKALSSNITLSASDVGARASTWMPTASDVGAAPGGYGLGGFTQALNSNNDLSTLTGTGFFGWGSSVPANAPFNYGVMLQIHRANGSVYQRVWQLGTSADKQISFERVVNDGQGDWVDCTPSAFATASHTHSQYAPAGYGLGTHGGGGIPNSDLNQAVTIGWYQTSTSTANKPSGTGWGYAVLLVERRNSVIYQTLKSADGFDTLCKAERYSRDGGTTWTEWKVSDSGGFDLLWENASPSSAFGSQTVNISGLSNYRMILVDCLEHRSSGDWRWYHASAIAQVNCPAGYTGGGTPTRVLSPGETGRDISYRPFTVYSGSIYFAEGRYLTELHAEIYTSSNILVPLRIYGIK